MLSCEGKLEGVANGILYRKAKIKEGSYLYAFKDIGKAHGEENTYIDKINKNSINLAKTRVQSDFSLIGSEFINFIATLITTRIIKEMEDSEMLKDMTYGDLMDDLAETWRKVDSSEDAASDDRCWLNVSEGVFSELEVLNLSKPIPKPLPKKPGRPRTKTIPDPNAPKKKKGRPPKKEIIK